MKKRISIRITKFSPLDRTSHHYDMVMEASKDAVMARAIKIQDPFQKRNVITSTLQKVANKLRYLSKQVTYS